jgi:hypothetical protein
MKRLTNNVITGSDKRLGLYFYYSHHFGHNIVRKTTSLTGQRVKNDNAFKGFRESINRMKQASPIAASLYRLIPAENKQYAIYRLLTSEALKMLKAGLDTSIIIETLNRTFIEPLINEPEKEMNRKEKFGLEKRNNEKGLKSFIRYPQEKPYNPGRIRKIRRNRVQQHAGQKTEFQTSPEFSNQKDGNVSARMKILSLAQGICKQVSKTKEEKIPELVYLCRLPECKNLKIWIRSSDFPAITGQPDFYRRKPL